MADTNANGLRDAGDEVSYTFTVTNTGNTALNGVTVTDPLVTVTGGPVNLAIAASDTSTFTATYVLTQADVDKGYLENTAIATGAAVTSAGAPFTDSSGNPVTATDDSDTGTNPDTAAITDPETVETPNGTGVTDGDATNDPTLLNITTEAGIVLVKSITGVEDTNGNGLRDKGDTVSYVFSIRNTGNALLQGVSVNDPKAAVSGGPITLAVGETNNTAITATYVLKQKDVDRGYAENSATVTGNAATTNGTPLLDDAGNPITVSDISDTGTDPATATIADPAGTDNPNGEGDVDGDPSNDPTVLTIEAEAAITVVKTADISGFQVPLQPGDPIVYSFAVTNTGNVTLENVTVTDPLPGLIMKGDPIARLAPGKTDKKTFTATYAVTAEDIKAVTITNQATATGSYGDDGDGNPLSVTDLSGTEGDNDAPTIVSVGKPKVKLNITIGRIKDVNGNGITDKGDVIYYRFEVTNTGDIPLTDVNMILDSLSLPLDLKCKPVSLEVDEKVFLDCSGNGYVITAKDAKAGTVTLTGDVEGTGTNGEVVTDTSTAPAVPVGFGGLELTKMAGVSTVSVGDYVPYTITATNSPDGLAVAATLVDILPPGFVYQKGSGALDGVAIEPEVRGSRLIFKPVSIAPGATVELTLQTLVSGTAKAGTNTNRAQLISATTGELIAEEATATVKVLVDPVFACSTVIGRVFDDRNQDGYFNGPNDGVDRYALTDQDYDPTGKLGKLGKPQDPKDEKGLPGVRLVTPNGTAITTDEHGRYSVPCAALPRSIGSNFMLRVDERTLPSGYRLTTENPKVVRVTPGMMTKMNFGATLSRVVRIDLSAKAFGKGDAALQPRPELVEGLRGMVTQIASQPSMLRITYQSQGEDKKLAQRRLREVERIVRKLWPANGRYQLNIETVIERRAASAGNQ